MSFLQELFGKKDPNLVMQPLYRAIINEGRQPDWYLKGGVPDTLDGRFDMIAAILCMVLIRLEQDPAQEQNGVWLTELFISDMDGQLRQIGIGDMVVGKHVSRMMGALGGRLGAYRAALADDAELDDALVRNLYRGDAPDPAQLAFTASRAHQFFRALERMETRSLVAGELPGEHV